MKKRKFFMTAGIVVLLSIILALFLAYRMYNKPARSVENENAITIAATDLAAAFESNEAGANKKYLDKALLVSGTVTEVTVNQQNKMVIELGGSAMSGVQCTLLENTNGLSKGQKVMVKGFCTGYLTDVVLNQGKIVTP